MFMVRVMAQYSALWHHTVSWSRGLADIWSHSTLHSRRGVYSAGQSRSACSLITNSYSRSRTGVRHKSRHRRKQW